MPQQTAGMKKRTRLQEPRQEIDNRVAGLELDVGDHVEDLRGPMTRPFLSIYFAASATLLSFPFQSKGSPGSSMC